MGVPTDPISGTVPKTSGPDSGVQQHGPLVDRIYHQDTQLTSAELLAVRATNIEVVRAPIATWAVVPIAVYMFLDHGGTDYAQTAATDQLALLYNGGSEIGELGLAANFEAFIEAGADEAFFVELGENGLVGIGGITPLAATAIDLDNNGAAEYTLGDGTLSLRVFYRLLPLVPFS